MKRRRTNARASTVLPMGGSVLCVVLLTIAVWLWLSRRPGGVASESSAAQAAPSDSTTRQPSDVEPAALMITWPVVIERDPFTWMNEPIVNAPNPTSTSDDVLREAQSDLRVDAIVYRDESSVARVNDQVYKQGDEVSGFKILKIERRHILVEKDGVIVQIGVRSSATLRLTNVN